MTAPRRVRVMTWNLAGGGEDRIDAIARVVAAAAPDLLALQECVGWDEPGRARLSAIAAAIGVAADERHAIVGLANPRPSGTRYHLAIVARPAIARWAMHGLGLVHGALVAELAGLTVIATHLVWSDEDARLREVAALDALAPAATLGDRAVVLAGDLNALTRHDPYPADLDRQLAVAGIDKFGHPPRFDVVDHLLAAGWVDVVAAARRDGPWATAHRGRAGHAVATRTDHVLVSPAAARLVIGARVLDAAGASDHHPVIADLELE